MSEQEKYLEANRKLWDARTPFHVKSDFYDVDAFLAGKTSLNAIELEQLGDVSGKTMLHLQCHFGQDSLSWARQGAKVTGVDFSPVAIQQAQELNDKLGLDSRFICSDVYSLKEELQDTFDVVFTSYGVLCWLPDMKRWASTVAHFLKPGGTFFIVESHPIFMMLDETQLAFKYPYFGHQDAIIEYPENTYADSEAQVALEEHSWSHSLSEIIQPLLAEGLILEHFAEYPYFCYPLENMEKDEQGYYRRKNAPFDIPTLFSLKATKPK